MIVRMTLMTTVTCVCPTKWHCFTRLDFGTWQPMAENRRTKLKIKLSLCDDWQINEVLFPSRLLNRVKKGVSRSSANPTHHFKFLRIERLQHNLHEILWSAVPIDFSFRFLLSRSSSPERRFFFWVTVCQSLDIRNLRVVHHHLILYLCRYAYAALLYPTEIRIVN